MALRFSFAARATRISVAAFGALGLVAASGGCSLVIDNSAAQCESTANCTARGAAFTGYICGAKKTCVVNDEKFPCTTNAQCTQKFGANSICTGRVKACAKLTTPECPRVIGDPLKDDAVVLGAMFSDLGTPSSQGTGSVNAIELAVGDFKTRALGIPTGGAGVQRDFLVLACDDSNPAGRIVAAKHLVKDLDVPAIIGAENSNNTVLIATEVTFSGGTLLFSPAASSDAITDLRKELPPPRLLWRIAPPDVLQSAMTVDQIDIIEKSIRNATTPPSTAKLKIAVLYRDDTFGKGIFAVINKDARINGLTLAANDAAQHLELAYKIPTDAAQLDQQRTQLRALAPDIVVIAGNDEVIKSVLPALDTALTKKPYYLLTDGAQSTDTTEFVKTVNEELRNRIRGTGPGNNSKPSAQPQFESAFRSKFGDYNGNIALDGAYDAFYMIGLGAVGAATSDTREITGATIAKNMARLLDGQQPEVQVAESALPGAHEKMRTGGTLRLRGVSGGLSINPILGEGPGEIVVWCVSRGAAPRYVNSGRYLDVRSTPAAAGKFDETKCPIR